MNNRVLFMIIGSEVKTLVNDARDHREWYLSLGLDPNLFDTIVRGYVIDGKIIFFKGPTYSYDDEVIKAARVYTPSIRAIFNQSSLEAYCGILFEGVGSKWEPILKINENEITGIVPTEKKEEPVKKEVVETGPFLEFKNNSSDPTFIKTATIVTIVVLVLAILIKIPLFQKQQVLNASHFTDIIFCFIQIVLLGLTIYGYQKKIPSTKYMGVAASVAIIITLDFWDVVLGILYFVFSVDQGYFVKFINMIKNLIGKVTKKG